MFNSKKHNLANVIALFPSQTDFRKKFFQIFYNLSANDKNRFLPKRKLRKVN